MNAADFRRWAPARLVFVAGAAAIVCGAIICSPLGPAQAQTVNPPPPLPGPTFNPSTPNVVPQPAERPVSPGTPSLSSPAAPSDLSEGVASPAHRPRAESPAGEKAATPTAHHHPMRSHPMRPRRHHRPMREYSGAITGPSYFPGIGVVYPPYPDPCHWQRRWEGYLLYTCS